MRAIGEFFYEGHRIEYDSYGEGDRVHRAICVDLLGHGRSTTSGSTSPSSAAPRWAPTWRWS